MENPHASAALPPYKCVAKKDPDSRCSFARQFGHDRRRGSRYCSNVSQRAYIVSTKLYLNSTDPSSKSTTTIRRSLLLPSCLKLTEGTQHSTYQIWRLSTKTGSARHLWTKCCVGSCSRLWLHSLDDSVLHSVLPTLRLVFVPPFFIGILPCPAVTLFGCLTLRGSWNDIYPFT